MSIHSGFGQTTAPAAPSSYAGQRTGFDSVALLHSLRRCWFPALMIGLVLGCVLTWLAYTYVPTWRGAEAYLEVTAGAGSVLGDTETKSKEDNKVFISTQMMLVSSSQVLEKALENPLINNLSVFPDDSDKIVPWLQENLSVANVRDTQVIRLYFRAHSSEDARKILDAIIGAYQTNLSDMEVLRSNLAMSKLEDAIRNMESQIKTEEELLQVQAQTTLSGDMETLSMRQQLIWQELSDVRNQLRAINLKLREVDASIQLEEAMLHSINRKDFDLGNPDFATFLNRDPVYQNLMYSLNTMENKAVEAERLGIASMENNSYKTLLTNMQSLRQQMDDRARKMVPEYQGVVEARVRMNISSHMINQDMYKVEKENLESDAERLYKQVETLSTSSTKMKIMESDLNRNMARLQTLRQERENQQMVIQANMPKIQRLFNPREIKEPDTTVRVATMFMGGMFGLLIPLGFLVGMDFRKGRIYSSAQIRKLTGTEIIGAIPRVPTVVLRGGGSTKWREFLNQSVDIIAARLIREKEQRGLRVFLLTSAVYREARTFSAFHLALSLARMGHRVALVDADFRRGCLHRILRMEREPGLVEVLNNSQNVAEVVRELESGGNLWVMTTGNVAHLAESDMAGERFAQVMDELREQFDFVILDGTASLPVVDARLMVRCVDGMILCARQGYSQQTEILAAVHGFETLNAPMLGFVVIEPQAVRRSKRYK